MKIQNQKYHKNNLTFGTLPNYKVIDMEHWAGKGIYERYLGFSSPYGGMDVDINIKGLTETAKGKRTTPNVLIMYAIGKAMNAIDNAKIRLQGGKLVQFDSSCVSLPVPAKGGNGTFNYCDIDFAPGVDDFIKNARESIKSAETRGTLWPKEVRTDAIYCSHLPFYYKSLSNPTTTGPDFNPRVNWGIADEYATKLNPEREMIPITIQGHHSIFYGEHAAKFMQGFTRTIDELRSIGKKS